jgi:acyl-CoA thioesterase
MKSPEEIVQLMMDGDSFSHWMGVEVVDITAGSCRLECTVKDEMLNGFNVVHGGITYSLSDSALAFASNSHGYRCMSIETSIAHVNMVRSGDQLTVQCNELHRGKSVGIYAISIHNQNDELVSKFKGTVHISDKMW